MLLARFAESSAMLSTAQYDGPHAYVTLVGNHAENSVMRADTTNVRTILILMDPRTLRKKTTSKPPRAFPS